MIRKLLKKYINGKYTEHIPKIVLVDKLPMQYAQDGSVNYYLPSYLGVWAMPSIVLIAQIFLQAQKRMNIINTVLLSGFACYVGYFYLKIAFSL